MTSFDVYQYLFTWFIIAFPMVAFIYYLIKK